jgi:sortase A
VAGRILVGLGTILVLFATFQLWGTRLVAWHSQRELRAELEARLEPEPVRPQLGHYALPDDLPAAGAPPEPGAGVTDDPGPDPAGPATIGAVAVAVARTTPAPEPGEPLALLDAPTIGLTRTVVSGVGRDELRRGPGHYPTTPLPGHVGNAAVAGHRTTHGAPFADLDRLQPGDPILVTTPEGRFTYEVEGQPGDGGDMVGHRIVDPAAVEVLRDRGDTRLTLTACHPRYSARQRIVVTAVLVGDPISDEPDDERPPDSEPAATEPISLATGSATSPIAGTDDTRTSTDDTRTGTDDTRTGAERATDRPEEALGWQSDALEPTVLWATIAMQVAHAGWVLGRLWRRRPAWLLTAVALVVPLFVTFVHLDRLLPAL